MSAPSITSVDGWSVETYLMARGWKPTGLVTSHKHKSSTRKKTWWAYDGYLYPQFLALDLERLGWVKFLETL